jgi:signal transduction histidine kinase
MEQVKMNLKHIEGFEEIDITTTIDLEYDFYSDAFLVETIFHNMIENAVRFQKKSVSEHKFIKIRITQRSGTLVAAFIDNGIGIKQKDIDHIFKMFSKAALEHNTVGLGLYIVKQCVGKLNGSIALVHSDQQVTEFELTLPLTA